MTDRIVDMLDDNYDPWSTTPTPTPPSPSPSSVVIASKHPNEVTHSPGASSSPSSLSPLSPTSPSSSSSCHENHRRVVTPDDVSIPYQIDFAVHGRGKHLESTKRRITFRFGFASLPAIAAGRTGVDCRGSEHEVELVWSIVSNKRVVLLNGHEVHKSVVGGLVAGQHFELDFPLRSRGNRDAGHKLRLVAYAAYPIGAKGMTVDDFGGTFHQYDLLIDGLSYFALPKLYQLGGERMQRAVLDAQAEASCGDEENNESYQPRLLLAGSGLNGHEDDGGDEREAKYHPRGPRGGPRYPTTYEMAYRTPTRRSADVAADYIVDDHKRGHRHYDQNFFAPTSKEELKAMSPKSPEDERRMMRIAEQQSLREIDSRRQGQEREEQARLRRLSKPPRDSSDTGRKGDNNNNDDDDTIPDFARRPPGATAAGYNGHHHGNRHARSNNSGSGADTVPPKLRLPMVREEPNLINLDDDDDDDALLSTAAALHNGQQQQDRPPTSSITLDSDLIDVGQQQQATNDFFAADASVGAASVPAVVDPWSMASAPPPTAGGSVQGGIIGNNGSVRVYPVGDPTYRPPSTPPPASTASFVMPPPPTWDEFNSAYYNNYNYSYGRSINNGVGTTTATAVVATAAGFPSSTVSGGGAPPSPASAATPFFDNEAAAAAKIAKLDGGGGGESPKDDPFSVPYAVASRSDDDDRRLSNLLNLVDLNSSSPAPTMTSTVHPGAQPAGGGWAENRSGKGNPPPLPLAGTAAPSLNEMKTGNGGRAGSVAIGGDGGGNVTMHRTPTGTAPSPPVAFGQATPYGTYQSPTGGFGGVGGGGSFAVGRGPGAGRVY